MAHQYKEIKRPQTFLVPVDAVCDRCGKPAGIRGAGRDRVAWGEATIEIQGGGRQRADLCRGCAEEFGGWVGAGDGDGMQDGTEHPLIVNQP